MIRLLALTVGAGTVFFGFSVPLLIAGGPGLIAGLAAVLAGAGMISYAEKATQKSLQADTAWNRLMKADGEELLGRDAAAEDGNKTDPLVLFCIVLASAALAWLGSVVNDLYGRLWFTVFEFTVMLFCWFLFRTLSQSSR